MHSVRESRHEACTRREPPSSILRMPCKQRVTSLLSHHPPCIAHVDRCMKRSGNLSRQEPITSRHWMPQAWHMTTWRNGRASLTLDFSGLDVITSEQVTIFSV